MSRYLEIVLHVELDEKLSDAEALAYFKAKKEEAEYEVPNLAMPDGNPVVAFHLRSFALVEEGN